MQIIFYSVLIAVTCALILTAFFCGGFKNPFVFSDMYSFKKYFINKNVDSGVIYVDGAVFYVGYYTVEIGETYGDLLIRAGLIEGVSCFDVYGGDLDKAVDIRKKTLYINFFDKAGNREYVINVNSPYFEQFALSLGISADVIQKINLYKSEYGKIQNKSILETVLTADEYAEVFYMLFIGESL